MSWRVPETAAASVSAQDEEELLLPCQQSLIPHPVSLHGFVFRTLGGFETSWRSHTINVSLDAAAGFRECCGLSKQHKPQCKSKLMLNMQLCFLFDANPKCQEVCSVCC